LLRASDAGDAGDAIAPDGVRASDGDDVLLPAPPLATGKLRRPVTNAVLLPGVLEAAAAAVAAAAVESAPTAGDERRVVSTPAGTSVTGTRP
jgi:hypothetical protein